MSQTIIAIVVGLLFAGFIYFAFRQGMKVSPDDRGDRGIQGRGQDGSGLG
jgi:hypothetical protein